MTTKCLQASSEQLTLYFYGELRAEERRVFEQHLPTCDACAVALAELELMRAALSNRGAATRSDVEWEGFMRRLEALLEVPPVSRRTLPVALRQAQRVSHALRHARDVGHAHRHARGVSYALAATLILSIALGLMWQRRVLGPAHTLVADAGASDVALAAAAARHFERAKLVVLGIAMKDPAQTNAADWEYERHLAASLLPETRLFRLSATDRGDARLASLLGDLESVLLQASMTTDADAPELQRLQRVIRRRDLLVRMDLREL